jgi:hypothetical protein
MSEEIKNNLEKRVKKHFFDSIETKQKAAETMSEDIVRAIKLMHQALSSEKKILACGNGGSAADAQHFAAELVGRFERERRELPAIALSTDSSILKAIANYYSYEVIFSKQVSKLQSGLIHQYAFIMFIGVTLFMTKLLFWVLFAPFIDINLYFIVFITLMFTNKVFNKL